MADNHSTHHIIQSLIMNFCIAIAKSAAAAYTASGAMLAEAIHSFADVGNQFLLLFGVKRAQKPADEKHPLGYGRAVYFWSFMVAVLLFLGGGVFSVYEGLHKMHSHEPISGIGVGIAVLLFSIALEGYATLSNIKLINSRRKEIGFFKYLRRSKDSDLVVVFGENLAATLGLLIAIVAIFIAWWTENPWWDGFGSLMIGVILLVVALFLAVEIKSLLLGENADPEVTAAVESVIAQNPDVTKLLHLISVQQGPGQVLLLMKLGFKPELTVSGVADVINKVESEIRKLRPEVSWCFVEPDRPRV